MRSKSLVTVPGFSLLIRYTFRRSKRRHTVLPVLCEPLFSNVSLTPFLHPSCAQLEHTKLEQ